MSACVKSYASEEEINELVENDDNFTKNPICDIHLSSMPIITHTKE